MCCLFFSFCEEERRLGVGSVLLSPKKPLKNHWSLLKDQGEERRWNHVQLVCPEEVRVQLQEKGEEKETTLSSSPTSTQRMGCEKYSVTQAMAGPGKIHATQFWSGRDTAVLNCQRH